MAVNIGPTFGSTLGGTGKGVGSLVSLGLEASFAVAGLAVLFFLLIAGYNVIAGAGGGDSNAAKKGKDAATYALFGFVVIFVAYWVIRLIESITGIPFITNPGF